MPNNNIVDSSTYNHTLTLGGTPVLSSKLPYPTNSEPRNPLAKGGSIYFDGNSYIDIPINNTTNYGTGDFTLEFWTYVFNNNVSYKWIGSGFSLYRSGTTQKLHVDYRESSNVLTTDATVDIANRWAHIAVTRTGGNMRLFLDGTLLKTIANSTDFTSPGAGRIGAAQSSGDKLVGYLAGFHSIMGTCLYTASFTPGTILPAIHANTKVLLKGTNVEIFDAVGQTALYMSATGVSLVSSGTRKYGNGAISFNGSSGFLRSPNGPGFVVGTGQFTAEAWIYPAAVSGSNRGIFGQGASASSQLGVRISTSGTLSMWVGGTGNILTGTTVLSTNTWYHVALVRTGSHVKLFINGQEELSTTNGLSYDITGADVVIGRTFSDTNGEYFSGYIDDMRYTKAVARYNSAFTAPAERFAVL